MTSEGEKGLAPASGTGPSQAEPVVSALRASVPDADRWTRQCQGYDAWATGKPFDKFQFEDWQEGWMVGFHSGEWKALAQAVGASVTGFSGNYAATFVWPDGTTSEIGGGVLRALRRLTAPSDSDASLAEDAKRLSPEGVPARASSEASPERPCQPHPTPSEG